MLALSLLRILTHLDGLNWSRAWMLEGKEAGMPCSNTRRRVSEGMKTGTSNILFLATVLSGLIIMGAGCSESTEPIPQPEVDFIRPRDGQLYSGPMPVEIDAPHATVVSLYAGENLVGVMDQAPFSLWVEEEHLPLGDFLLRAVAENESGQAEQEIWCGHYLGHTPVPGEECPDFRLPDQAGEMQRFSDLRAGRPTLLNLWASWCPPCIQEMPDIQEIHDDFGPDGLFVLACSVEQDSSSAIAHIREQGFTFSNLHDPDDHLYFYFLANAIPRTFLLDAEGVVRHSFLGRIDPAEVRPLISDLLE